MLCIRILCVRSGGGGAFYWDQNATEAPNGGTIVGTTGNPGRWKRIISNNPENYKVDVRWFGAKGDGANNDTTLIQKAIDAADVVVFPAGSYLIRSSLNFPAAKEYIFEDAVIKGHFDDFLIKLFFDGRQVFHGNLTLMDDDGSVKSEGTTLTKGLMIGNTSQAIHNFNSSACVITCIQLKQAIYIGELSYSNCLGSIFAKQCGQSDIYAVELRALAPHGSGANNILINSLQIESIDTNDGSTWNGKGAFIDSFGITINSLHIENVHNTDALVILSDGYAINGGYLEVHGQPTWNQLTLSGTGVFNGVLINCPLLIQSKTTFIGCRFLMNPPVLNATFIGCRFPNGNFFINSLSGATAVNLPKFEAASSKVEVGNPGVNLGNLPIPYTLKEISFDFYGGAHLITTSNDTFLRNSSLMFTKTTNDQYSGGIGFLIPSKLVGQKINPWFIVKIPATNVGLKSVKVGAGGFTGSGNYNVDSIAQVNITGDWVLVVMPEITAFSQYLCIEPGDGGVTGDYFLIDSFGCETGGISFIDLHPDTNKYIRNGRYDGLGTGSTATFSFSHGFGATPGTVTVNAGSSAASAPFFITSDSNNINVTFGTSPANGVSIILYWTAIL